VIFKLWPKLRGLAVLDFSFSRLDKFDQFFLESAFSEQDVVA